MIGSVPLSTLMRRLAAAGVQPGDSDELQLKKQGLIELLDEKRVRLAKRESLRDIAAGS